MSIEWKVSSIRAALNALYELECQINQQLLASPAPVYALFTRPQGTPREADYLLNSCLQNHVVSVAFAINYCGHGEALGKRLFEELFAPETVMRPVSSDEIKSRLCALRRALMQEEGTCHP